MEGFSNLEMRLISLLGCFNRLSRLQLADCQCTVTAASDLQTYGINNTVGRLILLYKGLKGAVSIPTFHRPAPTHPLTPPPPDRHTHTQLGAVEIITLTFHIPTARIDIYKGSFYPQTVRDWTTLPDSIIPSSEGAEDGVARFTSLVRAGD